MAHQSVEILIGRLLTDAAFRQNFTEEPYAAIGCFVLAGHDLSGVEIRALTTTPCELWDAVSEHIDKRLQKTLLESARN